MKQLTLEENLIQQQFLKELNKPAKQQIQTADVVMFMGCEGRRENGFPVRIKKGTLGDFVN